MQVFCVVLVFISFERKFLGPYSREGCQAGFQSGCTVLPSTCRTRGLGFLSRITSTHSPSFCRGHLTWCGVVFLFTLPWLLVIISVFLGIYWPFVCLLWRNLFRSFAHFKNGVTYITVWSIHEKQIPYHYDLHSFLPLCVPLFTFLWYRLLIKHFGIYKSTFFFLPFLFVFSILCVGEYCLSQYFQDLHLYFLLRVRDFQLSYLLL